MYNKKMSWYLYIAEARTGIYYTGITTDPKRRIKDHNRGKGSSLARSQGPFTLLYVSEPLSNQSVARKYEIEVKGWNRKKKERLINGELAGSVWCNDKINYYGR
jgi:putative endonuclease